MSTAFALAFLDRSRRYLTDDYLPRIRACVERVGDPDALWWRPPSGQGPTGTNSIGNLVLHLAGNARQWIVSGVGGAPDTRQRQREFDERGPVPRDELLAHLTRTVQEVDAVLARVTPEQLLGERRRIQGHDVTVMEAIYHVVEHFSMHTGQIILLAKMRAGDEIRFYDVTPDGVAKRRW